MLLVDSLTAVPGGLALSRHIVLQTVKNSRGRGRTKLLISSPPSFREGQCSESSFDPCFLQRSTGMSADVIANHRHVDLLLATGVLPTTLDRGVMRRFGVVEQRTGEHSLGPLGYARDEFGRARLERLQVGNCFFRDFKTRVQDEKALNEGADLRHSDHVGVLGLYELRALSAVIDCGARRLYVISHQRTPNVTAGLRYSLTSLGFTAVPLHENRSGYLATQAYLNGSSISLTLETASFLTTICRSDAARAGLTIMPTVFEALGAGQRRSSLDCGAPAQFLLGDFRVHQPQLGVTDVRYDLLGMDLLTSNGAVIDIPGMTLFLRRGTKAEARKLDSFWSTIKGR